MNEREQHAGGVLSDGAICERVHAGELIVGGTFCPDSLHPASYDMTIAADGLIRPDGDELRPRPHAARARRVRPVVLESGDTALFSTKELLCMPCDVAGNITIKNRLAAEGLTLLSGLLVDPGYGRDERADDEHGCRLFLHVVNTGRHPISLSPGEERIARIQFLQVVGERWAKRKCTRASRWSEQQQASLGFLTDLKRLKEDVERSDNRSKQVVLFGVVVLAVALIGAAFSTILSIVTNGTLSKELHHAWPASSRDGVVWAVTFGGVGVWVLAIVLAAEKIRCYLAAKGRRKARVE
jgi:deoxycytidine triphosphate deaminase